jgi:hypothetical protein
MPECSQDQFEQLRLLRVQSVPRYLEGHDHWRYWLLMALEVGVGGAEGHAARRPVVGLIQRCSSRSWRCLTSARLRVGPIAPSGVPFRGELALGHSTQDMVEAVDEPGPCAPVTRSRVARELRHDNLGWGREVLGFRLFSHWSLVTSGNLE